MTYKIEITLVNETKGHQFSNWDEDLEEWLTKDDGTPDFGRIYKLMQADYGRCQSSVYVDTVSRGTIRTGWYFVSRQEYEDARPGDRDRAYLRGAWVTIQEVVAPAVPETRQSVAF